MHMESSCRAGHIFITDLYIIMYIKLYTKSQILYLILYLCTCTFMYIAQNLIIIQTRQLLQITQSSLKVIIEVGSDVYSLSLCMHK